MKPTHRRVKLNKNQFRKIESNFNTCKSSNLVHTLIERHWNCGSKQHVMSLPLKLLDGEYVDSRRKSGKSDVKSLMINTEQSLVEQCAERRWIFAIILKITITINCNSRDNDFNLIAVSSRVLWPNFLPFFPSKFPSSNFLLFLRELHSSSEHYMLFSI